MHAESVRLSFRQQEVCDRVVRGMSSKEIATELGISHRTVDAHREEVYRRMGVRSAVELVRKLMEGKR